MNVGAALGVAKKQEYDAFRSVTISVPSRIKCYRHTTPAIVKKHIQPQRNKESSLFTMFRKLWTENILDSLFGLIPEHVSSVITCVMESECDGLTVSCLYRLTPVYQSVHQEIPSILFHNALNLGQCFSTAGPWHQLYRAARGSSGICNFSFLSNFHK